MLPHTAAGAACSCTAIGAEPQGWQGPAERHCLAGTELECRLKTLTSMPSGHRVGLE